MKRVHYLSMIFFVLLFLFMGKVGFFDPLTIEVDNFKIERPLQYKYIGDKDTHVSLDGNHGFHSFFFMSVFTRESAAYGTIKIEDHVLFKKTMQVYQDNDINISNCNILYKKSEIALEDSYFQPITIISYPYIIIFNELDKEREERFIKQVCASRSMSPTILQSHR